MSRSVILILLITICLFRVTYQSKKQILINSSLKKLFQPGPIPAVFKKLSKELNLPGVIAGTEDTSVWPRAKSLDFCKSCARVVDEALAYASRPNGTDGIIFERGVELCIEFNLGDEEFCLRFIGQTAPEMAYIMAHTPDTDGNDICGTYFLRNGCTSAKQSRTWEIKMPDQPKPPIDQTPYPMISEVPTLKILQLTDIHLDVDYEPGSNALCDETLCCQSSSTGNRTEGDEAGYWGDYRVCDLPRWTLDAILENAAKTHPDIDFILWTGDHMSHNLWSTITRDGNLALTADTFDMIMQYFPNTTVLPTIGNHEGHPKNMFAQPYVTEAEFDVSWLYDELAEMWQRWLPGVGDTVAYGGYYAVVVRPGLRVVSINSNYCYCYNWWLIMDSKDVAGSLEFLANALQSAEDAGDNAYILSHTSPGNPDCDHSWSHQFNRIVLRYENTVSGIFHGHTHQDHFEVYFDPADLDRAYEVGYICPSQTPFVGINPGYNIHIAEGDFEGSQYRILDHESYMFDLGVANADPNNTLKFERLYSFLDAYNLTDISPQSIAALVQEMTVSESPLFDEFFKNLHRDGINVANGCDDTCKKEMLCSLYTSDSSNHTKCDSLQYS